MYTLSIVQIYLLYKLNYFLCYTIYMDHSDINMSRIKTYQSGMAQSTAHRLLNRVINSLLEPYGLTSAQWFMIGHIYDAGADGVKLTDLMNVLDTKLPFITNSINLLESRGIVHKTAHPTDNRIKLVTIRPGYRKQIDKIEAHVRDGLRQRLYKNDHITREELSTYITVIYKMIGATKE